MKWINFLKYTNYQSSKWPKIKHIIANQIQLYVKFKISWWSLSLECNERNKKHVAWNWRVLICFMDMWYLCKNSI